MFFFVLQGKPGTRLASSEIVSDQLDHCSAFSTERKRGDLVGRGRTLYGLTETTDKRKRRERACHSVSAPRDFERENGFAVGEKVAKKKGEGERQRAVLQFRLAQGPSLSHLKRHDRHCLIKEKLLKIPLSA